MIPCCSLYLLHSSRTYFWFRVRGHQGEGRRRLQVGAWVQSQYEHLIEKGRGGGRTEWENKKRKMERGIWRMNNHSRQMEPELFHTQEQEWDEKTHGKHETVHQACKTTRRHYTQSMYTVWAKWSRYVQDQLSTLVYENNFTTWLSLRESIH